MQIPKPNLKAQRAKRKRDRRKKDKKFQIKNETNWCLVGHWAEQTVSHHLIGRRHKATREEESATIRLCHRAHNELHAIGRNAFNEKYSLEIPDPRYL